MKSINELKASHARELADLEAQHAVAKLLPLVPSFVYFHPDGEVQARIAVEGLGGALEALKAFTVVPFTEYRNGSTLMLKPTALIPGIDKDKHCDQFAASLISDTSFSGASTTVKVKFFARIPGVYQAGGIVEILLEVSEPKGEDYRHNFKKMGASCEWTNANRLQIKHGTIRPNAALYGYGDRFHSWSVPGSRALHEFLFSADYADQDATGAKELSHLYGQFQNMVDEFDCKGGN